MMLVGRTALSVEISTNRSTPQLSAASASDGGAEGVVAQAGDRVVLDDRHVLVGGGVIDGLDAVALDGAAHERAVLHRAEHGDDLGRPRLAGARQASRLQQLLDLQLDLVELRLAAHRTAPGGAARGAGSAAPAPSRSSRRRPSPCTDLPAMLRASSVGIGRDGSRPSRSSASTGRRSLTVTRPAARSSMAGSVRTSHHQRLELPQRRLPLAAAGLRHGQQHLLARRGAAIERRPGARAG